MSAREDLNERAGEQQCTAVRTDRMCGQWIAANVTQQVDAREIASTCVQVGLQPQ